MTERVAEKSLAPGDHGTTYGGNLFVGAAVDTVLKMMERDQITEHVKRDHTLSGAEAGCACGKV